MPSAARRNQGLRSADDTLLMLWAVMQKSQDRACAAALLTPAEPNLFHTGTSHLWLTPNKPQHRRMANIRWNHVSRCKVQWAHASEGRATPELLSFLRLL